jgi:cyclopropane fatty-acyl-phospholipid synthase-like methyltransferase
MNKSDPKPKDNFFDSIYRGKPPWDVGEAQPALIKLLEENPPSGPVLDVGCGTGELALAIARRGFSVLGVDASGEAIAQAQAKADKETAMVRRSVEFRVGNGLKPSVLPGPFGAVVDSGFYHLFGAPERATFVEQLAEALKAGGRYYLLGFAIEAQYPNAPKQVREEELRKLFAAEKDWKILALRAAGFLVNREMGKVEAPAVAMCAERIARKHAFIVR